MTSFNLGDISASLSADVRGSGVSFLGQALKWENEEQGNIGFFQHNMKGKIYSLFSFVRS